MTSSSAIRSTSYSLGASAAAAEPILGSTTPRLWTPPLRELTPATSYGFDLIDFAADVCGEPFDPWQEWLSIHVGELLPDGRPRFRKVLVLVARQNGKTHWAKTLVKYWLFYECVPTILGTSTDRSYAKRTWTQIVEEVKDNAWLSKRIGPNAQRKSIGEETFVTLKGAEYTFAANNKRAGRSMTLHKWLCDEVREHTDHDTWNAASKAQNAVSTAQTVVISNQGDANAVVLDMLRDPALEYIETGEGDPRLGLFEWSSPDGAEPDDVEALAAANPNLNVPGHGPELEVLIADGRRAARAGGLELSGHRTEVMCQRVPRLDPAINAAAWRNCLDPGDLSGARSRVALCLDVAPDGGHVTLVAAAVLPDDRVRLEVVAAWESTAEARAKLPGLVATIKPQVFGWFPDGPAAALAADLADRRKQGRRAWPPSGVTVEAIRSDVAAACMGLAEQVGAARIAHSDDPLLNAQIGGAEKLKRGATWVFVRSGDAHVDAVYGAAGAVHLARTLPAPPPAPAVLLPRRIARGDAPT